MESFPTVFNGFHPLTIVAKLFVLYFAGVLATPLVLCCIYCSLVDFIQLKIIGSCVLVEALLSIDYQISFMHLQ